MSLQSIDILNKIIIGVHKAFIQSDWILLTLDLQAYEWLFDLTEHGVPS